MKHVRKQYNRFSFRLSLLGTQVDPGESYDTEHDAAVAADFVKHYLRDVFGLDLEASLEGEVFSSAAHRLNVDLSNPTSVLASLPARVVVFIQDHHAELEAIREAQPEVKPWTVLRKHPQFYNDGELHEWVLACERAELDCEAFEALNGTYFSLLMAGISKRSAEIIKPLTLAIKMHEGVSNHLLVKRLHLLQELDAHFKATAAYIKGITELFSAEELRVTEEMARLASNRPTLT